jgi:cupin superfamily acireductone dioxygenase involved in methionine salvage
MLAKFSREQLVDMDDEVRFIIEGRGIFHIHPANAQSQRSRSKQAI